MSRYDKHDAKDGGEATRRSKAGGNVLPGIAPDAKLRPDPDLLENGLPYVSKSRITTYIKCPANFYWKYWCGEREPGTYYTEKGTRLHETFETFHLNLLEAYYETGDIETKPEFYTDFLPHWRNWAQWIEQVGAFWRFEEQRWQEAVEYVTSERSTISLDERAMARWLPIEVEAEAWLGEPPDSWDTDTEYVSGEPPVGDAPWMGYADLIVDSRSVPGVEGDGVTIIDYKTGSAPTKRYAGHPMLEQILNEGIYLEGEYYGWLFENFYDVDAVAGFYPGDDELVISPYPNKERRFNIKKCVLGMQKMPEVVGNGPPENYEHVPQPLCNYSTGNCFFYNICPSTK